MRLREQSTLGWLMLPLIATTMLGHNVKQNPELLRGKKKPLQWDESGSFAPAMLKAIAETGVAVGRRDGITVSWDAGDPDARNFKAGDMRYWSTQTGEELTKEQYDARGRDDGPVGYVSSVDKDTGTIKVIA